MRALGLALVAVMLLLAGVQPASASSTPSKVGLVSFVASSYSATADPSTSASLTIDWPDASHAESYEIFMSRYNSMSHARTYTSRSSTFRASHLKRGTDYFFQVRGVNGSRVGTKSTHVGHTTIRDKGHSGRATYRVMTYNVCSRVCDLNPPTTKYNWSKRQPGALERVARYAPDVLTTQEADHLVVPPGYTEAVYKSAKRLMFKTSRFDLAPADADPVPVPSNDADRCSPTWGNGATGYVFLGFHGHPDDDPDQDTRGCRYAAWAQLIDKSTGKHTIFVDVHTVAGSRTSRSDERKIEMKTLFAAIHTINTDALPVVYAGDFNSNKSRDPDYVAAVMHVNGFYDAYDLATTLKRQHYNSYNDFLTTPRISYTWGDHLDHVWVVPGTSRVTAWRNGALIVDGRLPNPIPSDHSPVVVDLTLD
jgi:endonuclease/exonuclease/phosphatase family metal-dependent hydrolase